MTWQKIKTISLSLIILMMITIIPASAAGNGTSNDPYIITNQSELQSISNDLSAYYVLGNDIDLSGVTWTPIGSSSNPVVTGFYGNLDGRNHTITNLYLNGTDTDYIGLFSVITAGAQIENIMFTDCTVMGKSNVGLVFGACIMASGVDTQAIISNVDSENCTVIGSSAAVGGIAGLGANTNSSAAFTGCTANGMHVKASSHYVGGIAGYGAYTNSSAAFAGCTAEMCTVHATSNYAGGICGRIYAGNTGTFTDCIVKYSSIVAPSYVAGICPSWV